VRATSLEKGSIYAVTELEPNFVQDDLTLVALEVDGKTLDINHGYPARLIAPARPGVLQTKWLSTLETF
jgi:DMSO/TMAO reductase YedYZ molybdopterin-dependent catalytic subunit